MDGHVRYSKAAMVKLRRAPRRNLVESRTDRTEREFTAPELMSPQSISSLLGMVEELERSGADPSLWLGFCYRGTDWSFVKRTRRPDAD